MMSWDGMDGVEERSLERKVQDLLKHPCETGSLDPLFTPELGCVNKLGNHACIFGGFERWDGRANCLELESREFR